MSHFFKHSAALSILLASLLACGSYQATLLTLPDHSTTDSSNDQYLTEAKENQKQHEKGNLHGLNEVLTLRKEQKGQSFDLRNTIPLYRYNQDKVETDEPMIIIGFPGLTDPEGPTTLIEPLLGKYNICTPYSMITRACENEDIETHIRDTYRALGEEDRLRQSLLLVSESFGMYPAYGLTQVHSELNIAGMISIHGPWEGISGAASILKAYQKVQALRLEWIADSLLIRYNVSGYKIPKALATLEPNGPFLQKVRNTLQNTPYPILALAGKSPKRIGPYGTIYQFCRESKWKKIYSLGAGIILGSVDDIIQEYEIGNDGLLTTASALAENIPNKPSHFKGVITDAPHFHYELNEYPQL